MYVKYPSRTRSQSKHFDSQPRQVLQPRGMAPQYFIQHEGTIQCIGLPGIISALIPSQPGPTTFESFILDKGPALAWILQGPQSWDLLDIRTYVDKNPCISVSDRLYNHPIGTAAVTIWAGKPHTFVFYIPGLPEDQSAYRSKAGGIYAQLWFWHLFQQFFAITIPTITIGCDGESALTCIFSRKCTPTTDHRDIISGAQLVLTQTTSTTYQPYHVRGHQDKNLSSHSS